MKHQNKSIDIVIPMFDENDSIHPLYEAILEALKSLGINQYKLIFIDDGSKDHSWRRISEIQASNPKKVKGIKLRKNFGKSVALSVGFSKVSGDFVFTMDADLQDDPKEIGKFLNKMDEGYDLVSGWKQKRHDPLEKRLPSKLFNYVTSKLSGIKLQDFNCGFKAYRKSIVQEINLYGELHRFTPILADMLGYKIAEQTVEHHPRKYGSSKFGIERYLRGFLDLITVISITNFIYRPAHLFGGLGLIMGGSGFILLSYLSYVSLIVGNPISGRPLLFLGILLCILSIQFISLGILAELILRTSTERPGTHLIQKET